MKDYVFSFEEIKEGNTEEAQFLLGNKGAQLCEMTSKGLPVPPGFTITTEGCREFYDLGKKWPVGLNEQVKKKLEALEKKMGKKLGDDKNPLFVSVRSGSYVSMPGMMETILNLGMNDKSVVAFGSQTKNERAAWDSYRRFIQMFGDVVLEIDMPKFEHVLEKAKETKGVSFDTELDAEDLKKIVSEYKAIVKQEKGKEFPQNPWEQLTLSIDAVFSSWNCTRALAYRRINKLRDDAGTGVNVQSMVFGNMGNDSGTGVAFTRNPANGNKEHYGEFLINAQGEDVVAGIRTPEPIDALKKYLPKAYEELIETYEILEKNYKEMQDFEFTIEKNKLYLLQTRKGKRTAHAAVKIAVDMEKEGIISKEEAVLRVDPNQLNQLLHKQLDPIAREKHEVIAKGLAASPGAAVGKAVFNAEKAKDMFEKNPKEKIVLIRTETSPEDIEGMHVSQGFLTARGGITSHAAVVARGMGKPCVSGCGEITVHEKEGYFEVPSKGIKIKEFEIVSLDGATGEVYQGEIPLVEPQMKGEFGELMKWADSFKKLGVRTNADTPHDAQVARNFGAEGIGLCRTEHMFFEGERIKAMREMILADTLEGRKKALTKLLPYQKADFLGLFEAMNGLDVTIRLLDPPLHEFLPREEKDIKDLATEMKISVEKVKSTIHALHEFNPMLGFRGCRLAIVYPEIAEMQVQAIIEAAIDSKRKGIDAKAEIMVPVLCLENEMKFMKELIDNTAKAIMQTKGEKVKYKVGVMMELPRACIIADKIAEHAEFFSFGTNDLTQTTFGFSRDDAGTFIKHYLDKKIFKDDPFESVDQEGVGELIKMSVSKGRKTKPELKVGICGEQGGDPKSVEFCHNVGLSYVSCSPFRVPIARLAAAHAALKDKKK
ncbi:MAG: pyruvate, phosphate dikinase [Candidatus Diapherotrites archaeon]|nr:pyruvate, phosphate dikinase [Candidatus Diapherotrites archaeon]